VRHGARNELAWEPADAGSAALREEIVKRHVEQNPELTAAAVLAERLLEDTDDAVEAVAERAGFGTAAVLRHHFQQHRRTTPQAYRRAFRRTVVGV